MSVSVIVPTLLRPLTNGEKEVYAQGNSVAEAIDHLETQFPGIKARLVNGDQVHRFVNIYVNEDDIRFADGLRTLVKAGDSLTVLPAVAGG
ncbi:MoaD/ThiS family protein [Thauera linaloolentis]|uniref:PdtH, QsbE n=1 Tax=Thauera linaloolentis (strain DSM 12138 / JCM 21573 / CCUG 41526 / CIP 105981 / IAM 15112 / NBRC 102519 / 47Lol) TaxID=1123367 RepID=N6Y7I3_THAL4|nr:MoaD/ThiS family protein [Thauera linaloolentis]ENO90246.1 PdtH, QsbE [Thauera linaloolentis 47Lol = DSM 12138]MCM8566263.1 MoaD/ThiS family protein [Thauera linaloolentis]